MEIWRDIKGYEGKYQISDLGRIKSLNYRGNTNQEHILKLKEARNGYNQVQLYKNGKGVFYLIHRLVAEAFIPNPKNLPEINHKDENKLNNNVENLEWCTRKYNNNYGSHNKIVGESHKKSIICITTGEKFDSIIDASNKYNVDRASISNCCNNKRKSAGKMDDGTKLIWKFL